MDSPASDDKRVEQMEQRVASRSTKHDSADKHVTGEARYIDDIPEPDGLLHVYPGWYRGAARGKILSMDLDAVRSAEGVVAVLSAKDIPGINDCSPAMGDDPVFAEDEIVFHGQVVFAVVATDRDAARRACQLAKIEVEASEPVLNVAQARDAGITVLPDYLFKKGEAEQSVKDSSSSVTTSFEIGGQEHFYLEGQISMALPGEDGELYVHCSTQHPSEVQHNVAKALDLDEAAVTVEIRRMGGAFGGKESQASQWATLAALGAHVTGRPCKCRLDRDDDMIMTGKRHDFLTELSASFEANGKLNAVVMDLDSRCGCSADLSLGINDRAMFHSDNAYQYPESLIRSRRFKTNTVSNTAFRGFGGPQGMLAAERLMDAIACKTGLDPLDVRLANLYEGDKGVTPFGMPVEEGDVLLDIITTLEKSSNYRERRKEVEAFNANSPILKKGLALTPVKFGISFTLLHLNQAGALVHVYKDGSVQLNHGGTEMGQGLFQKVAQVAAQELGVSLDKVKITATNTAKVPNTSPTAASSGADLNGMAVANACNIIKDRLLKFAADQDGVAIESIRVSDNVVYYGDERAMSFRDLVQRAYLARISLSSTGFYATPKIDWDRENATGRPFLYFAYGASCSEVLIDTLTGEMKVERVDVLHDVGHSLNPALDRGQIEGGFVQGMGWLTTEELVWDDEGRLRTHAPSTYKIPTASDVPADFRVDLYASKGNPEKTIYRSKAVGEPPLMLPISVFCAINDAISSLRPGLLPQLRAPATAEAILHAVHMIKKGQGA
ncbi:xanthine dehydrogenase molybdopterin binding subunit [Rhodobacteraceae bacterium RKSG542]|uniref:xanthine dehydrogenase molybdopterin binding subunit n=1 Tax=Pseudovibrio flavus TaxID=2529854 RepID=UPI0012BC345F|nr:xanthine dehydrogenase molybdopterin binding subunit [Pseudovibrio flavus]MTI17540.1 xanthine dehydrogenase molybdopterin binding subunit [Pseudovibrio flavus]